MDEKTAAQADSELIDALGGTVSVTAALGVARHTRVVNWRRRGIPAHAWPAIAELARTKGVEFDEARMIDASRRELEKTYRRARPLEPA